MCSDISKVSDAIYLTSSAFPTGFRGTGICMCTAKAMKSKWSGAYVQVEHMILSAPGVCSEVFEIFTYGKIQREIVSECSPSQIKLKRHLFRVRKIGISFRRHIAINASQKTVVWLSIRGMFTGFFIHDNVMPYKHIPNHWSFAGGDRWIRQTTSL